MQMEKYGQGKDAGTCFLRSYNQHTKKKNPTISTCKRLFFKCKYKGEDP